MGSRLLKKIFIVIFICFLLNAFYAPTYAFEQACLRGASTAVSPQKIVVSGTFKGNGLLEGRLVKIVTEQYSHNGYSLAISPNGKFAVIYSGFRRRGQSIVSMYNLDSPTFDRPVASFPTPIV